MWLTNYSSSTPDSRMMCERCGETWHSENISECVRCKRDACPRCGRSVSIKRRRRDEWWCDVCLKIDGITEADFETDPPPKEGPAFVIRFPTPESTSIDNLKRSILRSRTSTFIEWSEDRERRKILRKSLKLLKFDVASDGQDFKVAPSHLPRRKPAVLEFTETGIQKLIATVGEMNSFPKPDWPPEP